MRLRVLLDIVAAGFLLSQVLHPEVISTPSLVLWAWERPEDLRFIDPATTGIAYLAATVNLQPDGTARFHFRQQPLRVPQDAPMIAVVRIESPPRYVLPDPNEIASAVAQLSQPGVLRALQIDFDARASEHNFYRTLIAALHSKTRLPIGITALASWCNGDQWINAQPISEAVPMFFRMGANESKDMSIHAPDCRDSIGLSTDEAWPTVRPAGLRNNPRIYVFNPHVWTKSDYDLIVRRVQEWK